MNDYGWDDVFDDGMFIDQSDGEHKKDREDKDSKSFEELVVDELEDFINDEE